MQTILVGVDGSESAGVAVGFAAEEAALRGAGLKVVSVWEIPPMALQGAVAMPQMVEGFQEQAEAIVREAVSRVRELNPDLICEGVALNGRPQTVLVEEAQGAALVVVGRRGQGGLASLLLGSVSGHVVNHAPIPVVVVPPPIR